MLDVVWRRYLVSFMRATDNYNEGEAHHKFNQMRRLLTSSGDNWVGGIHCDET